jgi:hypothetical protein
MIPMPAYALFFQAGWTPNPASIRFIFERRNETGSIPKTFNLQYSLNIRPLH